MQREDTFAVKVSVDGRDLGVWDKKDGGDVDSEETTYHPGGMAEAITLGGKRSTSNVTVEKLYTRDTHDLYHWLVSRAGRGAIVISEQPLDEDGKAFGRVVAYPGKLKRVSGRKIDSEGTAAQMIALEATVAGLPR